VSLDELHGGCTVHTVVASMNLDVEEPALVIKTQSLAKARACITAMYGSHALSSGDISVALIEHSRKGGVVVA
jgi:hypothetical protein